MGYSKVFEIAKMMYCLTAHLFAKQVHSEHKALCYYGFVKVLQDMAF